MKKITAPWSDEQVRLLVAHQDAINVHPYTCPGFCEIRILTPTRAGWVCTGCGYKQDWALEPAPISQLITLSDHKE